MAHLVTCFLTGRKSISGDSVGRSFWRLVHFSSFDCFSVFFGNSALAPRCSAWSPRSRQTPSNTPGHLVTGYVERVERWRHLGAAADLCPFRRQVTIYSYSYFFARMGFWVRNFSEADFWLQRLKTNHPNPTGVSGSHLLFSDILYIYSLSWLFF